jgi:hypothetical protein
VDNGRGQDDLLGDFVADNRQRSSKTKVINHYGDEVLKVYEV